MEKTDFPYDIFSDSAQNFALDAPADVDLLIVFILEKLDGLTKAQILEAISSSGSANYLVAAQCVSNLITRGAIFSEGEDAPLHITQNGRSALAVLGDNLPRSVAEKALRAALSLQSLLRNLKAHAAEIDECEDGYRLRLSLEENGASVLSLSLITVDKLQAQTMRDSFLRTPNEVLAAVTGALL